MKLHLFLTIFLTFLINCNDISGTETENDDENQSQRKISVEEYIARALAKELMKDPKYQDQVSPQNHQKNIIFNIL